MHVLSRWLKVVPRSRGYFSIERIRPGLRYVGHGLYSLWDTISEASFEISDQEWIDWPSALQRHWMLSVNLLKEDQKWRNPRLGLIQSYHSLNTRINFHRWMLCKKQCWGYYRIHSRHNLDCLKRRKQITLFETVSDWNSRSLHYIIGKFVAVQSIYALVCLRMLRVWRICYKLG